MEVGIIGLPGCGKTTLFNSLTGLNVDPFAGGQKPNVGMANIPDPRLGTIAQYIPPQKIIHAPLQIVDLPGVAAGGGAEKLNSFLSHVRTVDAICHVVRCFDDGNAVQPIRDIESMNTELILADLVVAEGSLDKAQRSARTGEREAKARLALLEQVAGILNDDKPVSAIVDLLSDEERGMLKSYGMVSAKPVLYVANIGEDDLGGESAAAIQVAEFAAAHECECVTLCAKLEAELAELDDADRTEMLQSMGLGEPAIGPLARAANKSLGLTTFYTAGEKEVRAWPVRIGASAPEAAGVIHSDLQRGFIRAECYSVDELVQYKSEKAIKEAGKMRSEGKSYLIQDGDVVHFLFNV